MLRRATIAASLAVLALCLSRPGVSSGAPGDAGAAPSTRPATPAEIAAAVRDLGHVDYETREKAGKFLWSIGQPAEQALREAVKSNDPEVVWRAQAILDNFTWGIYPDTPQAVVDAVNRYKTGDDNERRAGVQTLAGLGTAGLRALMSICRNEQDANVRQDILRQIGAQAGSLVSELLLAGDEEQARSLMELGAAAGEENWARTYAAYLRHTGGLQAKIKQLQALADPPNESATLLAYLCRAEGDLDGALAAAKKAQTKEPGGDFLVQSLHYERGDWKELAALQPEDAADIQSLGYRAAYARLAGNEEGFAKAFAGIQAFAQVSTNQDPWFAAKALFLNDRPREAIDILVKVGHYARAVKLLCAQCRFAEALKAADAARAAGSDAVFDVDLDLAVALHHLGEDDRAGKLLEAYEKPPGRPQDVRQLERLIRAEYRAERTDRAFALCLYALSILKDNERPADVFYALFGNRAEAAALWWGFLRQEFPDEPEKASLPRLLDVMHGDGPTVKNLVKRAVESPYTAALDAERRGRWYRAIADAHDSIGYREQAVALLEKSIDAFPSVPVMLVLGDLRGHLKQWDKAAAAYLRARQAGKDTRDPVPRYLYGWALTQSGKAQEGGREMEAATILTLGDEARAYRLADALEDRELDKEAAEFRRAILLTGTFNSWETGETLRREALRLARPGGDPVRAAFYHERARLELLRINVALVDDVGYLHMSQWVNIAAAQAALAAGQAERAADRVGAALDALPYSSDVVIDVAPGFEKLGRKDQADKLIQRSYDFHQALVKQFPKSASDENALAWLAVRTGRHLDEALGHAQRAVELAPKNAGVLDTLAEVCFQRGDTAQAIAHMKKCQELEPNCVYFRMQLERFQKGDKTIPPSAEDEP